jgi:hypothetical protein
VARRPSHDGIHHPPVLHLRLHPLGCHHGHVLLLPADPREPDRCLHPEPPFELQRERDRQFGRHQPLQGRLRAERQSAQPVLALHGPAGRARQLGPFAAGLSAAGSGRGGQGAALDDRAAVLVHDHRVDHRHAARCVRRVAQQRSDLEDGHLGRGRSRPDSLLSSRPATRIRSVLLRDGPSAISAASSITPSCRLDRSCWSAFSAIC